MKKNYLILKFLAAIFLFVSCSQENKISSPTAGFEVYKAHAINESKDVIRLIALNQAGNLYVGDTLVFLSKCTGEKNFIFTGDTIYNTDGTVDITRLANQNYDVSFDAKGDRYVRTEALLLPKENEDLAVAYGFEDKRVYKDESGNYYKGILPYIYKHPGEMRVVSYAVNYSDDDMDYKMNSYETLISIKVK